MYSLPPNTAAVTGQTIASAPYNTVNNDIANDLNTARPITAGGTGATNSVDARENLEAEKVLQIGDGKWSVRDLSSEGFLRRDGDLYSAVDYPELGAAIGLLPAGVVWDLIDTGITNSFYGIAAGENKVVAGHNLVSNGFISISTDGGQTFTQVWTGAYNVRNILYENGFFIAAGGVGGGSGNIMLSADGTTWTPQIIPSVGVLWDAAYNGSSMYVAVGDGGSIISSPNGATWTSRTSGTTNRLYGVMWGAGLFVAVGAGGVIKTSPDGITWTNRTSGTADDLYAIAYGLGTFLVNGESGTSIVSANGTSWSSRVSGTAQNIIQNAFTGTAFVMVGAGGVALYTLDTVVYSYPATGTTNLLQGVAYSDDDGYLYAGGLSGTFLKGLITDGNEFRVPDDDPTYGWIKAEDA